MMAPTPSYRHIWAQCDDEAIRDYVEEEALDAKEEKKDEEGTVKEDNKEFTRMRRQPWTVQLCQTHLIQGQ